MWDLSALASQIINICTNFYFKLIIEISLTFQISHLDKQESGVILTSGLVTFLPLRGDEEDNTRNNFILKEILKRV